MWVFIYLFYFICFYLHCVPVCLIISNRLTRLIVKQLLLLLTISVFTSPPHYKIHRKQPKESEWSLLPASAAKQLEMLIHFCFIINLSIAHSSGPSNRVHSSVCLCGRRFLDLLGFCIFHIFAIFCFHIDFSVREIKVKFCNQISILLIKCLEILHFLFLTHFSILH